MPKFLVMDGNDQIRELLKTNGIKVTSMRPTNPLYFKASFQLGVPIAIMVIERHHDAKVFVNDQPLSQYVARQLGEQDKLITQTSLLLNRLHPIFFWNPKYLQKARGLVIKWLQAIQNE